MLQAQSAPSIQDLQKIQADQRRFNQQEQLRREELLKKQDDRRRLPEGAELPKQEEAEGASAQCFEVGKVELEGADSLTDEEREQLTEPFIGSCVGLVEIKKLMRSLTNFYIDKGDVTTRVYIPQQDLTDGILRLKVVEGKVSDIKLEDPQSKINLNTAFPGLEGKLLNLRDIEQGLDQINRLQSNNATMELLPGSEAGETDVLVKNQQGRAWGGDLTLDNNGGESTGVYRGTLTMGFDNPLEINDFWSMSLSRNTDINADHKLSQSAFLNFNIPYGYWNFTGVYSESRYETQINSLTQSYISSGSTETSSLGVQRVLHRGQSDKLTLSLGVTHKDSENYIEDSLLESGSPKLTILNANLTSVFSTDSGFWVLDGGLSKGVDALGATEALPHAGEDGIPTSEFWKLNASASYSRVIQTAKESAFWSSSFNLQYTSDYLYGSEKISAGGVYTVRGFNETSISGDRGFYWRNDLTLNSPTTVAEGWVSWLGTITPYVALDVGYIDSRINSGGGTLVGAVMGFKNISEDFNFDLAMGVPIAYPDRLDQGEGVENYSVYMLLGLPF